MTPRNDLIYIYVHDTLHPAIRMPTTVKAVRICIAVNISCTRRSALLMPAHIMHTALCESIPWLHYCEYW